MPDATLEDFESLVTEVHLRVAFGTDQHVMPQPTWGQNAAYLGFIFDQMTDRIVDLGNEIERLKRLPNPDIIKDLAATDPIIDTVFGHGDYGKKCRYCSESDWYNGVITHVTECVWYRAKTLTLADQSASPFPPDPPEGKVEP